MAKLHNFSATQPWVIYWSLLGILIDMHDSVIKLAFKPLKPMVIFLHFCQEMILVKA